MQARDIKEAARHLGHTPYEALLRVRWGELRRAPSPPGTLFIYVDDDVAALCDAARDSADNGDGPGDITLRNRFSLRIDRQLKKWRFTQEQYDALMGAQDGRCALCRREFNHLVVPNVDHCHESGDVRGFLCTRCNTGLGLLKDDPAILANALSYLNAPPAKSG